MDVAVSSASVRLCAFATGLTLNVTGPEPACGGNAESVAVAVNVNVPDCVGVPASTPAGLRETPAGSESARSKLPKRRS